MTASLTANHYPLITIVGETASGKTSAAIEVAKRVNGEIICADSRTVYKQLDIATAKPTKAERGAIPHHLIDVVHPNEKFSAAQFKRLAEKCIQDIQKRGKVPIVVGGTGLYVDALLYNFQFTNKSNETYRTQLLQMNDEELTTLLKTKNIDTSSLNTKNRRHVIRAIERGNTQPVRSVLRKNTVVLGITLGRELLKQRIATRVDQMFREGVIEEIRAVSDLYGWDVEALSGANYIVVRDHLQGKASEQDVSDAFIKRDISLAKRQRTWFKRNNDIEWFGDTQALIERAVVFAIGRS
ncbi:MAG: tRNA dimethylallyltransferase [Patescibacteria group bacterium]|jgi:tRNA dimethylallyltransferase|nr:tRNA dimethylallyltransferase [Patescibacteria group bacterium]